MARVGQDDQPGVLGSKKLARQASVPGAIGRHARETFHSYIPYSLENSVNTLYID